MFDGAKDQPAGPWARTMTDWLTFCDEIDPNTQRGVAPRRFKLHTAVRAPAAMSVRTTELGSGTAVIAPKSPFDSSCGPAEK